MRRSPLAAGSAGYEELIFWARPPGMPIEQSTASLELIAGHVLPAPAEAAL
jgi:hypothetical protein